jgi:hypothetical protein
VRVAAVALVAEVRLEKCVVVEEAVVEAHEQSSCLRLLILHPQ